MKSPKDLMSIPEATAFLGAHPMEIEMLVNSGQMPAVVQNGQVWVPRAIIEQLHTIIQAQASGVPPQWQGSGGGALRPGAGGLAFAPRATSMSAQIAAQRMGTTGRARADNDSLELDLSVLRELSIPEGEDEGQDEEQDEAQDEAQDEEQAEGQDEAQGEQQD